MPCSAKRYTWSMLKTLSSAARKCLSWRGKSSAGREKHTRRKAPDSPACPSEQFAEASAACYLGSKPGERKLLKGSCAIAECRKLLPEKSCLLFWEHLRRSCRT